MNGQKFFQWVGYIVGAILALALIVALGQMWSQWIVFLVYVIGGVCIVRVTWIFVRGRQPWIKYGVMASVVILLLVALNSYLGISIKITAPNPPPIKWPERPAPTSTILAPPSPSPERSSPLERGEGVKKEKKDKKTNCAETENIPPCQRVDTLVKKTSETESTVIMNGSERDGVNTGLILKPGEEFRVEHQKGRITYNYLGDSRPIWGGWDFRNGWPVKYRITNTGHAILVIIRDLVTREEKIYHFAENEDSLAGQNPFAHDAKIVLYYNGVVSWVDEGETRDGFAQNGWDGSTATLKITVTPLPRRSPTQEDEDGSPPTLSPQKGQGGEEKPAEEIEKEPAESPLLPLPEEKRSPENDIEIPDDPNIF